VDSVDNFDMQDLVGLKTSDTDIQTARHVTVLVKVEVFNRETSLSETVLLQAETQTSKQQVQEFTSGLPRY